MLARSDQKRLPIGLVPTGMSNDFARSFCLTKEMTEKAVDVIAKGQAIGIDTTRVLLDVNYESQLPSGEERMAKCRHMLVNTSLAMPAKIANSANGWKGFCGSSAFGWSSFMTSLSCGFSADDF